tara:strand:- start:972 stop:2477 length:1506 start_codon:yes stop_codon:yes gene_type:complete
MRDTFAFRSGLLTPKPRAQPPELDDDKSPDLMGSLVGTPVGTTAGTTPADTTPSLTTPSLTTPAARPINEVDTSGMDAPVRQSSVGSHDIDTTVNTTRPGGLWPKGTPGPQLPELQKERIEKRNEQCRSLKFLPDPCAGTSNARSNVWVVSRNEKILETVLIGENMDFFLRTIAKIMGVRVVLLPRLQLEILKQLINVEKHQFRTLIDMTADVREFRKEATSIKEGEFGMGLVSFKQDENGHRMILIIRNTGKELECYIIDSNGRANHIKSMMRVATVRKSLPKLLSTKKFTLTALDTHNVNFRPMDETIEFLEGSFQMKISRKNRAHCRHFALFYAIEILSMSKGQLYDANYLTSFLYIDLLRRTQYPLTEPHRTIEKPTLAPAAPPPPSDLPVPTPPPSDLPDPPPPPIPPPINTVPPPTPGPAPIIRAPTLSFKEEAELMLYARALALGICKEVNNYISSPDASEDQEVVQEGLLLLRGIDLDENTFKVYRERDIGLN